MIRGRMAHDDTELRILASATDAFVAACELVSPAHRSAPTPCPEWDVSQLIDHVTGGNRFTISILGGLDGQAALDAAMASFPPDHDAVAAAVESALAQEVAFRRPGALDRSCRHLIGELSGAAVLRLRLHDLIIHTWDLHQALGLGGPLAEDHVAWAIAELAGAESLTAAHFASIAAGIPATPDELLRAFGRRATEGPG